MEDRTEGLLERASDPSDPSYDWVGRLTGTREVRDDAIRRLHELMVRASRFKLAHMAGAAAQLGPARADEVVQSSADEAVLAILHRLGDFEGRSRFTTWAYKFAILHTATAVRRELWRRTDVDLSSVPEPVSRMGDPVEHAEGSALAGAVREGIARALTPHQRRVLLAITVRGVPIDVVADRLGTSRNTVYKTLHDARRRLREDLVARGHLEPSHLEEVQR